MCSRSSLTVCCTISLSCIIRKTISRVSKISERREALGYLNRSDSPYTLARYRTDLVAGNETCRITFSRSTFYRLEGPDSVHERQSKAIRSLGNFSVDRLEVDVGGNRSRSIGLARSISKELVDPFAVNSGVSDPSPRTRCSLKSKLLVDVCTGRQRCKAFQSLSSERVEGLDFYLRHAFWSLAKRSTRIVDNYLASPIDDTRNEGRTLFTVDRRGVALERGESHVAINAACPAALKCRQSRLVQLIKR